jgi:hypothetical protein
MLRATAWTVGLFGAGTALCRTFSAPWLEPVVLLALGMAFLFVSARIGGRVRPARARLRPQATAPERAPTPAAAPATATTSIPVERSA